LILFRTAQEWFRLGGKKEEVDGAWVLHSQTWIMIIELEEFWSEKEVVGHLVFELLAEKCTTPASTSHIRLSPSAS
jgi:hypothetical protein